MAVMTTARGCAQKARGYIAQGDSHFAGLWAQWAVHYVKQAHPELRD